MSDLIRREDIPYVDLNRDMPHSNVRVWVAFKDSIDALPSAEPKTGWIPCSERLPKEGETVLVCMRLTGHKYEWEEQRTIEFGRISSDRYDAEGTGWEWLNESGADYWEPDYGNLIVAWMPLPPVYQGE